VLDERETSDFDMTESVDVKEVAVMLTGLQGMHPIMPENGARYIEAMVSQSYKKD
jgi:hypothetical protein